MKKRMIMAAWVVCGVTVGGAWADCSSASSCGQEQGGADSSKVSSCGQTQGGSECSSGSSCGQMKPRTDIPRSKADLTEVEAQELKFMREEEKLAHDVYRVMYKEHKQRVFQNIPRSEQWHMDAMLRLLKAYGIEDPAQKKLGKFTNQDLQKLYDDLVKRGSKSLEEAFLVGALIEEVDIKDLIKAKSETDKPDILAAYDTLIRGSEMHLKAFVRRYESTSGKTYTAQLMSQEEVNAILNR